MNLKHYIKAYRNGDRIDYIILKVEVIENCGETSKCKILEVIREEKDVYEQDSINDVVVQVSNKHLFDIKEEVIYGNQNV